VLAGLGGAFDPAKPGGDREDRISTCDPLGENLVKATLPGSVWTDHHDEINNQIHRISRQSGMVSKLEIEDYLTRKVQGMSITPIESMPILIKHLKGYVPNVRQLGIACNKFPCGIDQFTEVKVLHNGALHYITCDRR